MPESLREQESELTAGSALDGLLRQQIEIEAVLEDVYYDSNNPDQTVIPTWLAIPK